MCVLYARHILKIILCLARERMQECWPNAIWCETHFQHSTHPLSSSSIFCIISSVVDVEMPRRHQHWTMAMATPSISCAARNSIANVTKGIPFDWMRISKIWLWQINVWCVWLGSMESTFFPHTHKHIALSSFSLVDTLALFPFSLVLATAASQVTKEMNIQAVWYTISTNYQEYKWILSLNSYAVQAPMPNWNAHQVCPR